MKKLGSVCVFAVVAITVLLGHQSPSGDGAPVKQEKMVQSQDAHHSTWCDSIYHQNVSCPKHGKVVVPVEVIAKQEADFLVWCDSIYHQNVSCPKHGKVVVPVEVIAKQEADFLVWCDSISHRNAGCPGFKR